MRLPRGICPVCGRDVALRNGGLIREHAAEPGTAAVCAGTGTAAADEFSTHLGLFR